MASTRWPDGACGAPMSHSLGDVIYRVIIGVLAAMAMILLLAPTVVVLIASLTGEQTLRFPPASWSFRWYGELLTSSPEIVEAATTSLRLAGLSTLASAVLGTMGALG